jgi:hypothetical protein
MGVYKIPKSWLPFEVQIVEDGKPENILHSQIIDLPAAQPEKPEGPAKPPEEKDATT